MAADDSGQASVSLVYQLRGTSINVSLSKLAVRDPKRRVTQLSSPLKKLCTTLTYTTMQPIQIRQIARSTRAVLRRTASIADCSSRRGFSASSRVCKSEARLRFAPSPTGQLHLGGLRTALFNHLYARALGGKWILRIEDTDQKRLVPGSVSALQDILAWAKLDYDEGPSAGGSRGPYVQSERLDLYRDYAHRLLKTGKAYRDFRAESTAPYVDRVRIAKAAKAAIVRENYIPPDEAEAKHLMSLGKKFVVRLHADPSILSHNDLVYGEVKFPADPNREGTEDPILLKSDGNPTYHLANVVDDHEMGITHVLRGEEWLPSLPKHISLYRALGLEPPHFAHLPLLMNADGSKLSKRSGDVDVQSYRDKGYEPEALINYLGLMGYNNMAYHSTPKEDAHGNPQKDENAFDVLSMQEMINGFDVQHINRSRATVNFNKLNYLNSRHLNLKIEDREGGGCKELVDKARPELIKVYPNLESRFQDDDFVRELVVMGKVSTTGEICPS